MKAVIIGGGVAGLSAAIGLEACGVEVVVKERAEGFGEVGLGFVLLPRGLAALESLGMGDAFLRSGESLRELVLRIPSGNISMRHSLSGCLAIKRSACVAALRSALSRTRVHTGFEFARLCFDGSGAVAAVESTTGVVEEGDLFLGADGAFSAVRAALFPDHELRCSRVKELVGSTDRLPEQARSLAGHLIKTQSDEAPLSFGLLPCSASEIVWYMQFDGALASARDLASAEERKSFVTETVEGWPEPIAEVLGASDFGHVFVWNARDLEMLPALCRGNVVLVGDAAHLTLPFTSQGATSALCDAVTLVETVRRECDGTSLERCLESYAARRRPSLARHLEYGRMLEARFLNPEAYRHEAALLPFSPDPRDALDRGVS
jgi:2-polyprenyl-6-methoxyphenol hydroxylase-like FAD-dependent oxidoreductase